MTQHDRILRWLKERGENGVHSFELVEAHMPRGAAVVCALRKEGYEIEAVREPYLGNARGVRYILRGALTLVPAGAHDEAEPQFDVGRSRPNQYDPYSDFA